LDGRKYNAYKPLDVDRMLGLYPSHSINQLARLFKVDPKTIRARLRSRVTLRKEHAGGRVKGQKDRVPRKPYGSKTKQFLRYLKKLRDRCYWMYHRDYAERALPGEHARMERSHG